jgi:hypothetical protein
MAELDESSGATRPPPERSDEGSGTKRPRVDEAPSVVEVHVAAMLATRTGPERATAAHVVSLLHVAEGVDTVASEPTADGRTLTLRSGPFFLRPATAPEGPLPPALLWCFACLACGAGEEPEVTFDEAESRAAQESEIPNFKGSDLGRFPLVSADFWTSDHLSERS